MEESLNIKHLLVELNGIYKYRLAIVLALGLAATNLGYLFPFECKFENL